MSSFWRASQPSEGLHHRSISQADTGINLYPRWYTGLTVVHQLISSPGFTLYCPQSRGINLLMLCMLLRVRHQNLVSGTYLWMLDKSSHCAVIVAYKEINYRTSIMELIFYHLQNCSSLHTFRYHLKVILALAFLCFLSPLISSITLLSVL